MLPSLLERSWTMEKEPKKSKSSPPRDVANTAVTPPSNERAPRLKEKSCRNPIIPERAEILQPNLTSTPRYARSMFATEIWDTGCVLDDGSQKGLQGWLEIQWMRALEDEEDRPSWLLRKSRLWWDEKQAFVNTIFVEWRGKIPMPTIGTSPVRFVPLMVQASLRPTLF